MDYILEVQTASGGVKSGSRTNYGTSMVRAMTSGFADACAAIRRGASCALLYQGDKVVERYTRSDLPENSRAWG